MNTPELPSEADRLEQLWNGQFGNDYVDRNRAGGEARNGFWKDVLDTFPVRRVLEVGCNIGANLHCIAARIPPQNIYGMDINLKALDELHRIAPAINALWGPARELPFRDQWFDLVFTTGVLIHQPDSTLPLVMAEIVRCSKRYVLCGEYYAHQTTEVPYRQQTGALFKRDYGRLYQELFPELVLRKQGSLGPEAGWDDITYWIFEKPQ